MAKKYLLLNRIYELRTAHNLDASELAAASKLSVSTISDVEKGLKQPTHPTMLKICKGFGLKLEDVFENDPNNVNL
jgi:transcriptional regulator with XRE-family HTH domain